jgi:hypothetical protein
MLVVVVVVVWLCTSIDSINGCQYVHFDAYVESRIHSKNLLEIVKPTTLRYTLSVVTSALNHENTSW